MLNKNIQALDRDAEWPWNIKLSITDRGLVVSNVNMSIITSLAYYKWNDLMLLSFLLNIHSQYFAAMHRPSSWVYQALLTWAFCFGSWFRSECCQQVNYHLYGIYKWNDLMLLSFLLNIHSQYSAAMHRPSSWVYQALLMWAFCFGSWFRSECCQQVNYHL